MSEHGDDPVGIWRALHGSRDFPAIVTAGHALCQRLENSRVAWRDMQQKHAVEVACLELQVDGLEEQLGQAADQSFALAEVVRSWHHETHPAQPWPVCSHWLCRHTFLTYPGVSEHHDPPRLLRSEPHEAHS